MAKIDRSFTIGLGYEVGTLDRMGAGFMPVAFGVLMLLAGVAIWVTAPSQPKAVLVEVESAIAPDLPEWRGWICIIAGVMAFIVLGNYGGLIPATFAAVFISALGDRRNTLLGAAGLAALVDVFGVAVFHFGLQIQLPLFQWG